MSYFEIAKDLLLDASVAKINPDYDPNVMYSKEILITHPAERIFSYDETRMEIDITKPGKGKGDHFIKNEPEDDGAGIGTKSSKTASAICGHLGDGRPLPVYIVFASGE